MKAKEAPEKLYLDATSKCGDTIFTIRNNDEDIEYTRTDAFIEKVCDWMDNHCKLLTSKDYEDFRTYMKGE